MRVVVTGGAGYIGSAVAALLVEAGEDVAVVDDFSTGHADAVPDGVDVFEASVLDATALDESLRGADAVLHFAAKSLVGESVADPSAYWRNNTYGTMTLLDAMRRADVPRLVFSSTAAVYGEPAVVPITEDAPTAPTSPYGASKLAVDHLIGGYARAHGLAATSLRYFNVAGSAGGRGERHPVETHLIPLTLQVAAGLRDSLDVYGTDYETPDGTAIRDYIHLEDLCDAHVLALSACREGRHDIYNLGNGLGHSVLDVVAACRRVTGASIPTRERPRRPGDPARLVASSRRIAAALGWQPKKTTLDEIVGDAWRVVTRAA